MVNTSGLGEDEAKKFAESMNLMSSNFSLHAATMHIPFFDGKNVPLRQFTQEVENGQTLIGARHEDAFFTAVKARLKGLACECIEGVPEVTDVDSLIKELAKYFSPGSSFFIT